MQIDIRVPPPNPPAAHGDGAGLVSSAGSASSVEAAEAVRDDLRARLDDARAALEALMTGANP
jgi:hypothetical protein